MTRAEMVEILREREDAAARAWETANMDGDKRAARTAKRRFLRALATRQTLEHGYTVRIRATESRA